MKLKREAQELEDVKYKESKWLLLNSLNVAVAVSGASFVRQLVKLFGAKHTEVIEGHGFRNKSPEVRVN